MGYALHFYCSIPPGNTKGGILLSKIDGYIGICAICFWPIKEGEGHKEREKGRNFHIKCAHENPNSYYLKLEKRLKKREACRR